MGKIDRTGEERVNNFGSKMKIINYKNANDIDIYFEEYNWVAKNKAYTNFIKGKINCPYERKTYGVGYIGEGNHKPLIDNKKTKVYNTWGNMLKRCYDKNFQINNSTYTDCKVCNEWLCFQNFADWYDENYYEIEGEIMELDKDILVKGNKIYSPNTCIFVPHRINSLFVKRDSKRGEYPIGVTPHRNKFRAECEIKLGVYNTIEEAFQVYKKFKENYIKEIAEEYKSKIPQKLYKAMINYEVEITD